MREQSRFQNELKKLASRQMLAIISIGCLFFCVAIVGTSTIEQRMRREEHLDAMADTFSEIYQSASGFLEDEEITAVFRQYLLEEVAGNQLKYEVSKFNLEAPVGINVIVSDADGNVVYTTFPDDDMNLHRMEFNRAADKNARKQNDPLYSTVYYLAGDLSEYVLLRPLYENDVYIGSAAAYLKGEDWGRHFLKYQYDTILTNANGDIIYCSNSSFLPGRVANKYRPGEKKKYEWINESRYLVGQRHLTGQGGLYLYSFIYSPRDYTEIMIGIMTIFALGVVWFFLSLHLIRMMAAKTSASVEMLADEIRIIRKENSNHVIRIETGDEIEEIAEQINKMVTSIKELNQSNLDLLDINNRMEIQNLQAQIKPHFIYNTLDNIRFLIAQDAKKADELIGRFTHILRYSINNAKHQTFLWEDMEYIQDYLIIQKTRFGDRFQYTVEIDEECNHVLVPKLLLQPLIENSLKYGFLKKADIFVKIRGWIEEGYLVLRVEDDGPGQTEEVMEMLRDNLRRGEINTEHIGLRNINRRVALEYGKESGLTLDSPKGGGFIVTLRLWIGG